MTTQIKYEKPSEFLEELDSHAVYGVGMLEECGFDTSSIPTQTAKSIMAEIEARGLGGWMDKDADPEELMFSGWKAAYGLARHFLGHNPGDAYHGRGSAFRADLDGLKEAGY